MTVRLQPADEAEVVSAVAEAIAARRSLDIVGRASRRGLGRPVEADAVLDLSALTGVVIYEPNELVLTVRPATALAEVQALLAAQGQHLAFEPPDLGPLWGAAAGGGTIGGAVATGLGGPRRVVAGGPRDHLLGFKAVNGFGEAFAAGGRVVKNVTGYDLPKLMAGAFGTLGVLTELTLKVLPAPPATKTLRLCGLDEAAGLALLRRALGGRVAISAAAYLPGSIAARTPGLEACAPGSATLLRLEGPAPVVASALAELCETFAAESGAPEVVGRDDSLRLWTAIAGAAPLAGPETSVWRVCAPPACAAALGAALRAAGVASLYWDWGGGMAWVAGPAHADGGARAIRDALTRVAGEGHATLVRGSETLRREIAPFQPMSPGVAGLTRRVKAQFDPLGLLNPGRQYEGI